MRSKGLHVIIVCQNTLVYLWILQCMDVVWLQRIMKLRRPQLHAHQMRPQDDPKDLIPKNHVFTTTTAAATAASADSEKHSDVASVTQPVLDEIQLNDAQVILA